ncbi:MAG: oligosaccharide flippase family protein [Candidatus Micrarchaeia archaeon]
MAFKTETDKRKSTNEMIKSSFWAYSGIFFILFLGLISTVILARLLDKENWGILSTIIAVVSFLSSISEIGLNYYIVYLSSKYDKNKKELKYKLASPLRWKLAIIFLIAFLMFIFSENLASLFNIKSGAKYFLAGSIYFIFYNLFIVLSGILDGIKKFREESIISTINQLLRLILSAGLVILGFGIDGAITGYIISVAIATFIQSYILRNVISFSGKSEDSLQDMFSFGFFYGITSIAATFTMWTDSIMIGFFLGTTSVGIYRIAVSIASSSSSLLSGISKVSFSYFTSAESEGKDSFGNLNTTIKYLLFISLPAVFGLALLSDSIVNVFFGLQYIDAAFPLMILSYFIFDGVITGMINSYLGAKKLTKQIGMCAVLASIINIILNLILIPAIGIIGAATASVVSRALGLVVMVKWSEKILKVRFIFPIKIPLLSSLIMAGAILLLRLFFDPGTSFINLFLFILFGISMYLIAANILGFKVLAFITKIFNALVPQKILRSIPYLNKIE